MFDSFWRDQFNGEVVRWSGTSSVKRGIGINTQPHTNLGAHVPRDGEEGLHLSCEEFDSLCLHQIMSMLAE